MAVLGKLALGNNLVLVVLYLSEPTRTLLVTLYAHDAVTYQPWVPAVMGFLYVPLDL